ncbi:MAG: tyrosine-type recombinase/integrase [Aquabacterium sp.]
MTLAEAHNGELDAWRLQQGQGTPKKRQPAGSVAAMITAYQASKWWPAGDRTRKDYRLYLNQIADWAGDMPARAITPRAVQAFHDAMASRTEGRGRSKRLITTPARAAAAVRVLSALLSAGKRLGFVDHNTALRAGIKATRQRDPVLWTRAQLDHLVLFADAMGWHSQGTAMVLNFWCGQRQADILALPPYRIDQGAIVLKQGKTGRRVSLPVHLVPELVTRLEAQRTRANTLASATHLLLHEGTARPWQSYTFTHIFADIRAAAAHTMPSVATLQWMELRHTAVTMLKAAGMDALAIASITGHTAQSVQAILDKHYLIRTAAAAEDAFKARLEKEGGNG